MACYHPIPAYQDPGRQIKLWPPVGHANINLPCGTCLGCRTDKATDWARRAEHEASQWQHNCFLTLTYSDERLPTHGQLEPQELTRFIKRLRRAADRAHPALVRDRSHSLRYLAAGEYGEHTGRPHYHLLLFNCNFGDTHKVAKHLLESHLLQQLWPQGVHRLGTLTGASANYVAQYTVKKLGITYPENQQQPFIRMSLKPAIGTTWLQKYKTDLQGGYLVTNGSKGRVPRAYKQQLAKGHLQDQLLAEQLQQRAATRPGAPLRGATNEKQLQDAEHIHKRRIELQHLRTL